LSAGFIEKASSSSNFGFDQASEIARAQLGTTEKNPGMLSIGFLIETIIGGTNS
jgi:hypothetical protein